VPANVNAPSSIYPSFLHEQITAWQKIFIPTPPVEISSHHKEINQSARKARQDIFPTRTRDMTCFLDEIDAHQQG